MLPRAKKSFGQHFLKDRSVLKKIIAAADIRPGEAVLEIGPGTGVLTQALLDAGANVTAIEADRDLVALLHEKFGDRITLIQANALNVSSFMFHDSGYKLIANIPYNITSAVIEKFLTEDPRPIRMVLLVQKEVADRMTAKPPNMSVLSVACQLYADVKKVANVPPGAFSPPPKVDSAIVVLDVAATFRSPGGGLKTAATDPEHIIALAKAGFRARRKQLHRNLADAGVAPSEMVKKTLEHMGLTPNVRAEQLTVENWRQLKAKLKL
jgi:16S rRNA (adenine1518-N6/adenine1519-N6)-dimethyltransferase